MPSHSLPWTSVFLSYSHADKLVAHQLAEGLREAGCHVWIDEGELRSGDSIIQRISTAVEEVRFVAALISPQSAASLWCQKELAIAVHGGLSSGKIRVLPLRLGTVEMPPPLRDVKYTAVDPDSPREAVARLVEDMRSHLLEDAFATELQPKSSMSAELLVQMRIALRSHEDDIPERAMTALVNDRSVPAATIFFEETLLDAKRSRPWGYAGAGLTELGPAAAPWMHRLLTHEDDKVVRAAFYSLHDLMIPNPLLGYFRVQAIVCAVAKSGNWGICETRLRRAVPESDDLHYFLETVTTCAAGFLDLTKDGPTR